MDAATINAKIYAGRAKAAIRLGTQCAIYRPTLPGNPLATSVGSLLVALNAGDNSYLKPNKYGNPIWFADMDGRLTQVGDYLVGAGTYFIGAMQSLLPIIVIECNSTLRLTRTTSQGYGIGAQPYSGLSDAWPDSTDALGQKMPFIGWPCSLLMGKGAENFGGALPSSPKTMPGWQILLPASVPTPITMADRFMDASGRIFSVQQAELTDIGWRIAASEVHA